MCCGSTKDSVYLELEERSEGHYSILLPYRMWGCLSSRPYL